MISNNEFNKTKHYKFKPEFKLVNCLKPTIKVILMDLTIQL